MARKKFGKSRNTGDNQRTLESTSTESDGAATSGSDNGYTEVTLKSHDKKSKRASQKKKDKNNKVVPTSHNGDHVAQKAASSTSSNTGGGCAIAVVVLIIAVAMGAGTTYYYIDLMALLDHTAELSVSEFDNEPVITVEASSTLHEHPQVTIDIDTSGTAEHPHNQHEQHSSGELLGKDKEIDSDIHSSDEDNSGKDVSPGVVTNTDSAELNGNRQTDEDQPSVNEAGLDEVEESSSSKQKRSNDETNEKQFEDGGKVNTKDDGMGESIVSGGSNVENLVNRRSENNEVLNEQHASSDEVEKKTESKDNEHAEQNQDTAEKIQQYDKADITNTKDWNIRYQLDDAEVLITKGRLRDAEEQLTKLSATLEPASSSPRLQYLKARLLDEKAEVQRSNKLLEEAIDNYLKVLDMSDVPVALLKQAGKQCAQRQTFRGFMDASIKTLKRVLAHMPDDIPLMNDLGVQYLIVGRNRQAQEYFEKVLELSPDNGFAQVHLGFVYKVEHNDPATAVPLLRAGLASGEHGTDEGKFYFHLGDSLQRLGEKQQAYEVYEQGAKRGHFLSTYQRSLYNVDTLLSRAWWTQEMTMYQQYFQKLAENWEAIRDEGVAQLDPKTGMFVPEDENLSDTGEWKQFTLYQQGRRKDAACKKTPVTCALIDEFPAAATCKRGQVKFSVMHGGVHVWPHCGPTNCRIRAHLGLVVPPGPRIRVANETRTWSEGEFLIFDDSFEHEVWHDGTETRLVLIVDVWHPDLTARQRATLTPI